MKDTSNLNVWKWTERRRKKNGMSRKIRKIFSIFKLFPLSNIFDNICLLETGKMLKKKRMRMTMEKKKIINILFSGTCIELILNWPLTIVLLPFASIQSLLFSTVDAGMLVGGVDTMDKNEKRGDKILFFYPLYPICISKAEWMKTRIKSIIIACLSGIGWLLAFIWLWKHPKMQVKKYQTEEGINAVN